MVPPGFAPHYRGCSAPGRCRRFFEDARCSGSLRVPNGWAFGDRAAGDFAPASDGLQGENPRPIVTERQSLEPNSYPLSEIEKRRSARSPLLRFARFRNLNFSISCFSNCHPARTVACDPALHPSLYPAFRVRRGRRSACTAMRTYVLAVRRGAPCDFRAQTKHARKPAAPRTYPTPSRARAAFLQASLRSPQELIFLIFEIGESVLTR